MAGGFSVEGTQVTVAGAARSGVAAAALLARRGARVTLSEAGDRVDGRDDLIALGVRVETGGNRPEAFAKADLVVLSPGVPPDRPFLAAARSAGVPVIGELELASRWLQGRLIAITGTKGKSTTTTLTGQMLEAAGFRTRVGGNIGRPLSAQVEDSTPDTLHVVEASSFQLETIVSFHPWIAAILNFSPDHLDRHADEAEYASAKARIFSNQEASDWSVVNADEPPAAAIASSARSARRWFGFHDIADGVTVDNGVVVERRGGGSTPLVAVDALQVKGRHILSDVLAATAISRIAGAGAGAIAIAVSAFRGLEHAMEMAGTVGRVRFVNDSKATNIAAARQSIESVDRDLVAIVGGRFKGGDFRDLRAPLRGRARAVVAIGESRALVRAALGDLLPVHEAGSLADAVRAAYELASPNGTVLLAPACSSFDMFADYAERGRRFKEEVARLARGPAAGES
jgi:UDP-N-acetylmuramoylalanine--D-glutamate ligase